MLSGVIFSCSLFSLISSSPISNALRKCEAHQEDLDDCLMDNLNVIVPSLKSGWEWMDLPGVDPVELPQKMTPYYHDGNMTLDVIISNSAITGLSDTRVIVVRSKTFSIGKLEVMSFTPRVTFKGEYSSEGYTGIFPLHSVGHFNITFIDVNTAWVAYFSKTVLNGVTSLNVDNLKLDAMPMQIFIDGAHSFDGSNEIARDMRVSLNANSIELYDLLKPRLMAFMSQEIKHYINAILPTVPMNDLVAGLNLQDWKKR